MTTDSPEGEPESGGSLRARLEAQIATTKTITQLLAQQVSASHPHVKVDDFNGVDPHQYAAHAAELEAQRVAEREELLREAIKAKGIADGDVDSVLAQLTRAEQPPTGDTPAARLASIGANGVPPAFQGPEPQTAEEWIKSGLRKANAKQ